MSEARAPAFVTGATGLLGGRIVDRLVADGRPVTALVRSAGQESAVAERKARPARGDVLDEAGLVEGMRGSEVLYHLAGLNAFCLPDPSSLYEVNVEGSRNVVRAAGRAGVRRVVYTSSAATLGEPRGTVGSETSSHRGSFLSHYERSKYLAERAVWEEAERSGVEVVCVNPASVQGPGRSTGTAKLLVDYLNGRLKVAVDTQMSLVDIDDCTEGHLLAETRGVPGERYVLCGATLTVHEVVEILRRVTGVEAAPRMLPAAAAIAAGALAEILGRVRRRRPPVCREMIRTLLHGHAYDGSKATSALGLRYTPVEETIRRTIDSLRREGLIPGEGRAST